MTDNLGLTRFILWNKNTTFFILAIVQEKDFYPHVTRKLSSLCSKSTYKRLCLVSEERMAYICSEGSIGLKLILIWLNFKSLCWCYLNCSFRCYWIRCFYLESVFCSLFYTWCKLGNPISHSWANPIFFFFLFLLNKLLVNFTTFETQRLR